MPPKPDRLADLRQALALHQSGRLEEAAGLYRAFLARHPKDPNAGRALANLGAIHLVRGDLAEAGLHLKKALRLNPGDPQTLTNQGVLLRESGRPAEAAAVLRQALRHRPDGVETLANLGVALTETGELEEAVSCLERVLSARPDHLAAAFNLGVALERQDRLEEAVARYEAVLRLDPRHTGALVNLGRALSDLGRGREALQAWNAALALDPGNPDAHWNSALALLTDGDFARGWDAFEWRWAKVMRKERRSFAQPEWDGRPLDGRTLLIGAEQGLGDGIQFLRFLPLAARRGAGRILLEVPHPLLELFRAAPLPPETEVIARAPDYPGGAGLPPFDVFAPMMSLPRLLGTGAELFGGAVPYLRADLQRRRSWAERLSAEAGDARLLCGLVWAGRPAHGNDRRRSMALERLRPLSSVPGVRLVSLQIGPAAEQARGWREERRIIDVSGELRSFTDTAALIMELDLVVTVDTAVAHLAGALGKPVWVLLPFVPDWRWQWGRVDSPWYPTLRLIRQPAPGAWEPVVETAAAALAQLAARQG
ncbi:tetratricopeptide repeat protein [Azospirillum sp. SYSU D00513]|uniref:tetratricopeptide repeat protein n=1 Tax=Azospirillum sp. SYSU D00513 TaxID=2812561 RepID=UPI001A969EB9|nr:tetratricopeptide repeat protein [Azospirillum sp. SYSU D00513]